MTGEEQNRNKSYAICDKLAFMHLLFITHETVTTRRGATNIVSYIQANRTEWKVLVDRKG
jgi:hypothetical protein